MQKFWNFSRLFGQKWSDKIRKGNSKFWKFRPVKSISVKYLDWRNPLLVDLIILTRTASNPSLYFILTRKNFFLDSVQNPIRMSQKANVTQNSTDQPKTILDDFFDEVDNIYCIAVQ